LNLLEVWCFTVSDLFDDADTVFSRQEVYVIRCVCRLYSHMAIIIFPAALIDLFGEVVRTRPGEKSAALYAMTGQRRIYSISSFLMFGPMTSHKRVARASASRLSDSQGQFCSFASLCKRCFCFFGLIFHSKTGQFHVYESRTSAAYTPEKMSIMNVVELMVHDPYCFR
jgi:hypothetical protein